MDLKLFCQDDGVLVKWTMPSISDDIILNLKTVDVRDFHVSVPSQVSETFLIPCPAGKCIETNHSLIKKTEDRGWRILEIPWKIEQTQFDGF